MDFASCGYLQQHLTVCAMWFKVPLFHSPGTQSSSFPKHLLVSDESTVPAAPPLWGRGTNRAGLLYPAFGFHETCQTAMYWTLPTLLFPSCDIQEPCQQVQRFLLGQNHQPEQLNNLICASGWKSVQSSFSSFQPNWITWQKESCLYHLEAAVLPWGKLCRSWEAKSLFPRAAFTQILPCFIFIFSINILFCLKWKK